MYLQSLRNSSDLEKALFHKSCRAFLVAATKKLLDRNPLKYAFVRDISCLVPRSINDNSSQCEKQFRNILCSLIKLNRLTPIQCDNAGRQFSNFCVNHKNECLLFNAGQNRLDK